MRERLRAVVNMFWPVVDAVRSDSSLCDSGSCRDECSRVRLFATKYRCRVHNYRCRRQYRCICPILEAIIRESELIELMSVGVMIPMKDYNEATKSWLCPKLRGKM